MDELGFNKIAGAILATALGVMMIREVPHLLMHSSTPATPVYQVGPIVQEGGNEEAKPLPFPQADWVAAMDATKGAKVFKKCTSCHNADEGGAKGTGPNLWNVIGAPAGGKAGFKYSSAMATSGLTWDYETLNAYLTKPTKYLKGTNMNFIGLKKPTDRAAVIEYLRVASDNFLPKPEAAAAEVMTAEETSLEKMNGQTVDSEKMDAEKISTEGQVIVQEKIEPEKIDTENAEKMIDAEKMEGEKIISKDITEPARELIKEAPKKILEKVGDGQ